MLTRASRIRIALALLSLVSAFSAAAAEASKLLLATTTSVQDTGLLDALLPLFRERTGIAVQVVAVGSGAALRMGADGNADVIVSHDPKGEQELVASGAALGRTPIMENYFVIAGPREDPAKVAGAPDPAAAFRAIAAAKATYVSRGDDSGTHRKEKQLLAAAGLDAAKPWEGFTSTGSGMGLTLQVAGERRGYALSDIGTFLAYRERTKLVRLTKDAPALRNEYAVLRISPKRFPKVNAEGAQRFEAFLVDPDTQRRIGEFGQDRYGSPLFNSLRATTPAPAKSPPAQ
jgi:tungstate transport system substrate-binding protein